MHTASKCSLIVQRQVPSYAWRRFQNATSVLKGHIIPICKDTDNEDEDDSSHS